MALKRFRRSAARPAVSERRARLRRGRISEVIAAGVLMAKGYRVVGRRVKTPAGEIDIIAVRAKHLAFVEVKRRLTREDAEAAITKKQASRVRRAANLWLARHPRFREHEFGFDVVFLVPRQWPRHIANGL